MNSISGIEIKQVELEEKFLRSLLPDGFKFYLEPDYHQLVSLVFALQFDGVGLFSDMGTGKTKPAIDYLRALNVQNNILVITVNAAVENWVKEFKKNAGREYRVCGLYGSLSSKNDFLKKNYDVFIINYDALFQRFHKLSKKEKKALRIKDYILPELDRKWDALILDESRCIMNNTALRTKVALYLANKSSIRSALTGLPIAKNLDEIFTQYFTIDHGQTFGESYRKFRWDYFFRKESYWGVEWEPKVGADERIHKKMYRQAIRYAINECIDLPDKIYLTRYTNLSGDQKEHYEKLKQNNLNVKITKSNKMFVVKSILIKFMQICGGWLKTEGGEDGYVIGFKSNEKLSELFYLLSGELQFKKVIVVASFVAEQKGISSFLETKRIQSLRIKAGMDGKEVDEVIQKFSKQNYQCLIISPRVGGRALNLTMSNTMIFYSQDFDVELNKQTEGRVYRRGQKNKVTYIRLICKDSVDEKVTEVLNKNRKVINAVVEGKTLGEYL